MSAHRTLNDLSRAFDAVGPGHLEDPGDAGTIEPTQNFQICEMVSEAAETRTLANPTKSGIRFVLRLLTDGGTVTVTAENGLNVDLDSEATFADESDFVSLISVTTSTGFRWEILEGNVGTVVSSASASSTPSESPSDSPSSSPSDSASSSPSDSPSSSPSDSPSDSPSSSASAS